MTQGAFPALFHLPVIRGQGEGWRHVAGFPLLYPEDGGGAKKALYLLIVKVFWPRAKLKRRVLPCTVPVKRFVPLTQLPS